MLEKIHGDRNGPVGIVRSEGRTDAVKSPVVSIAKIRGCVRGASSEFVSRATCASHRARTRGLANPKSQLACIRSAAAPNACRTWSAAVAPSKSFSAAMISTATQPSATGTSIVPSRMRNWTVYYKHRVEWKEEEMRKIRKPLPTHPL
jgi:hypothetical protein